MQADLYSAQVEAAGTGALAHRTDAGFIVLSSSDGSAIIELIEAQQAQPDLIDQVVAKAAQDQPQSFAMLFTAGGDLFLLAHGDAVATVQSASVWASIQANQGQVAVYPVSIGIHETAAVIRLSSTPSSDLDPPPLRADLRSGTMEANSVDVTIGDAVIVAPPEARSPAPRDESASDLASLPAPPPAPAEVADLPDPPAAPVAALGELPNPPTAPVAALDEPPVEAEVELGTLPDPPPAPDAEVEDPPVAIVASLDQPEIVVPIVPPPPPAAQEIVFAEDLNEIADLIDEPAVAAVADVALVPDPTETVAPAPPLGQAAAPGPVMVMGVACQQGHHNHPDALYCSQCGTKMGVHQTTVLINGPRPPLGVLVVDDGTTYSLNEDLVIGREPSSHPDVLNGAAAPMVLTDDSLAMSRQHARIVLDDWTVAIADLQSSNGTWLQRPGSGDQWTQVSPDRAIALEPGDRIRVGGRQMQVELHHVR